ncbi:AraC family transcriptional regulator [Trinickia symbiotica]|uniref:AraC family transcriptional regulator n=1 Tax=Trinickia symbiotica TaxID=863227 RepID=A0A2T3Y1P6_9BURK|nr:AraC family transcriptional regulator [Trinickia symbiotica]PTB22673.1 AraC family transcriptional regulator [Trinickia symbiotica]
MNTRRNGRVVMYRCALEGVEATYADTARSFARHSHDRFGVGVVVRGAQRSASGCGPVEARAGDAITVNPGEVHDGAPFDARGRSWRMLYLEPLLVHDIARDLGAPSPASLEIERPVLRDAKFADLFDRAFAAVVEGPLASDAMAREEALFAFLADVVARHTTVRLRQSAPLLRGRTNVAVARARMRIDDDPAGGLTLADLAAETGLSRFQLLREFTRETGLPPHAYLIQRRVALARRLIAAGAALADAALGAGFADQSHMTRAFVRFFGVTPAGYAAAVR